MAIKMTNRDVLNIFPAARNDAERAMNSHMGLNKLARSNTLDVEKVYEISLLIPALEAQNKIIIENRNNLSLKHFPMDETKGEQVGLDDAKKVEAFEKDYEKILNKEIEIEGEKITISLKKEGDKPSEASSLGLTAVDLIILKPILHIER